MKKSLFILLPILAGVLACTDDNTDNNTDNTDCYPEKETINFMKGKAIAVHYDEESKKKDYHVIEGKNIVFEYNHLAGQCDQVRGDEWGYMLTFEIADSLTEFRLMDEDIEKANGFYQQYGAWARGGQHQVKDGIIKGVKQFSRWHITIIVTTTPPSSDAGTMRVDFIGLVEEKLSE